MCIYKTIWGSVSLTGTGNSDYYLQGQADSVNLDLNGNSDAAIGIDSGT